MALKPFGSFVSVFHTAGSDIDISLEVSPTSNWYDPKEMGKDAGASGRGRNRRQQQPRGYKSRKVQLLSKVASELRYQRYADVNLVAHARVPLIKFRDPQTGVNCDVCVGNDGVYKSAVLGTMANLDSRYRDLVFLVKMWAKHFDCNDAMAGSFNSFALSLMSLFHLQTRSPPILPPCLRMTLASEAAADADLAAENERAANLEPIRKFSVSKIRQQSDALRDVGPVEQRARRWQGFGSKNNATLAELLVTFFTHFRAVEPLWRHGLVASTYAGRWVAGCSWAPGRYCLGVEDPFSAGDNVARAVQRRSLPKVLSAVRDGTLAVGRVVWAESDEDLERALYDLLGPDALPPQEVPQQGWPTLGGAGAVENILGAGGDAAGGATGGPRPSPGEPLRVRALPRVSTRGSSTCSPAASARGPGTRSTRGPCRCRPSRSRRPRARTRVSDSRGVWARAAAAGTSRTSSDSRRRRRRASRVRPVVPARRARARASRVRRGARASRVQFRRRSRAGPATVARRRRRRRRSFLDRSLSVRRRRRRARGGGRRRRRGRSVRADASRRRAFAARPAAAFPGADRGEATRAESGYDRRRRNFSRTRRARGRRREDFGRRRRRRRRSRGTDVARGGGRRWRSRRSTRSTRR